MAIQRIYEVLLQWSRTFYGYKTFEVIRNEEPAEQFINAPIPYPTGLDKSGKQLTSRHDIRSLRARFRIKMGSTAPSQSVAYMAMYQQLAQQYPVFLKQFVQYLDIPADEKREMVQAVDVVGQQQATIQEQQQAIEYLQKVIQKLQTQDVEHQKEHKIDQYEKQIIKKVSKLTADMERVKDKLELKGERAVQQLENEKTKLQSKPADAGD